MATKELDTVYLFSIMNT